MYRWCLQAAPQEDHTAAHAVRAKGRKQHALTACSSWASREQSKQARQGAHAWHQYGSASEALASNGETTAQRQAHVVRNLEDQCGVFKRDDGVQRRGGLHAHVLLTEPVTVEFHSAEDTLEHLHGEFLEPARHAKLLPKAPSFFCTVHTVHGQADAAPPEEDAEQLIVRGASFVLIDA